jgi:antitoxin component YwqK of YwqJK toxin-antitoxin module
MRSLYLLGLATIALATASCARQYPDDEEYVVDETYFHKYGVVVPVDFWEQSGEHGAVISTMADGVVITRSYCSGLLDGETTYTFPHSSQIQKKEIYSQGTLVKVLELYFDGTPQIETSLDYPSPGMKTISTWYLSGTPRSVEQFRGNQLYSAGYFSSYNQRDASVENYQGTRLVRDEYGQLNSTDTIRDGILETRATYHPNGSPKELTPYQDGIIHGEKRTFHPAGEPNTIEQWVGGQQNGTTVVYLHGEKFAEVPYVDGSRQGIERRYRDGDQLVQEINWNDGQMHGPATNYVGDTEKTEWYYQGILTSKGDYDFRVNKQPIM